MLSNWISHARMKNQDLKPWSTLTKRVWQKQPPPRGFLRKMCSEDMQQIYRRTPMPKCDFSKVALQLYWNRTSTGVFSCKFAAYFQNTFSQEHLWVAASDMRHKCSLLKSLNSSLACEKDYPEKSCRLQFCSS